MAVPYHQHQDEGCLEDTIVRMNAGLNSTISSRGVSISRSRGLTVDGEELGDADVQRCDIELGAILGHGASSVVRQGIHVRDGSLFAVKLYKIHDQGRRRQLVKEIRILFSLDCEALVQFYGAFLEDSSRVGVVLEYMDAGSLENVLSLSPARKMPTAQLGATAFQILWGLAYLHFENRLHRDVKPGNVLLNTRGEVKLSDFGIATDLSDEQEKNASTMVGTFRYMSPERLHGAPYSFESDVWSFGIMLLDAAAGTPVFSNRATPVEIVQVVKTQRFVESALDRGDFSDDFRHFILQCLQIDPRKRMNCDQLLNHPWIRNSPRGCEGKDEDYDDPPPNLDSAARILRPWLLDTIFDDDTEASRRGQRSGLRSGGAAGRRGDSHSSKEDEDDRWQQRPSPLHHMTSDKVHRNFADPLNQTYRSELDDDDEDD